MEVGFYHLLEGEEYGQEDAAEETELVVDGVRVALG